jgi:hypothetical protein
MTEDRPTGPVDGETVERDDDVTVRAVGTAGLAFVGFVLAVSTCDLDTALAELRELP